MFQTKVVEEIKTLTLLAITFFQISCCLWNYVGKYDTDRQTDRQLQI